MAKVGKQDRYVSPACFEEQARYVGIDNTFTIFSDLADYVLETDGGAGPDIPFSQVPVTGAGYPGGAWSEQIETQWVAGISAAAQGAGVKWIVEASFVFPNNPSSTAGGGNLPGPLTSAIAEQFVANGMAWRFVQITVCPGSPVPTRLKRVSSAIYDPAERDLLITPVQLGPFREFRVCERCTKDGIETDWYVRNDAPEADPDRIEPFSWELITDTGQIPKCAVPCGTIAASPSPTNPTCDFESVDGCDNGNVLSVDPITGEETCQEVRRVYAYCDGSIAISHTIDVDQGDGTFIAEEYTMLGELVDCDTKEPIQDPPVPCEEMIPVGTLWKLQNGDKTGVNLDYYQPAALGGTAVPHDDVSAIFGPALDSHPNGPSHTAVLPTPSFATSSAANLALLQPEPGFTAITDQAETSGEDQIRMHGYICGPTPFDLSDTNTNTGERGGVAVNGTIVVEDVTDSVGGDTSAFPATQIQGGVSQYSIATSDLSAWQGVAPSAADGVLFLTEKPVWKCIPVFKCKENGILVDCDKMQVVVTDKDAWCNEPARKTLDDVVKELQCLKEIWQEPCLTEVAKNQRCESYANIIASGYRNWTDAGDLDDLAGEFGITPTAFEIWVRIVEFKCGGVSQSNEGLVLGPYPVGGYSQFMSDLSAATQLSCLHVSESSGGGSNGVNGMLYEYDAAQDATLVIQEGVTVGGGPSWFTSAQGIVVRSGVAGDFISSSGNAATTNYDGSDTNSLPQFTEAENCESI